jgi:hypothetical protein
VAAKLESNSKEYKDDLINLLILLSIAAIIGIYLIVTTVLISKDGVFYIERAQQLASDPIKIIKAHPPGYPFLIFMAYKVVSLFINSTSNQTWIYSAQGVTLLCKLLALIPLYLIGKLLVGGKNSFWAILILIFLPFPTRIVCDVVREWPYLLFICMGFFFLLWGAKYGKWWVFSLVGLSSGLGYLIRPESAQLVVYGLLWIAMSVLRPKLWIASRWKNLIALALLLIGFAIPATPYMKCVDKIIPSKVNKIMKTFSFNTLPDKTDVPKVNTVSSDYNTVEIVHPNVLEAFGEIFETVGENLMWFFMPALVIGLYHRFRNHAKHEELLLITAFVLVSVTMMVLRYCYIQLALSKRWSLPLITVTIFYIPVGLRTIGNWLNNKLSHPKQKTEIKEGQLSWFIILFVIGIGFCMPKLLRPVRIKKQGYKEAAEWLRENTAPVDIIAVPDTRIAFYAEREGLIYGKEVPKRAKYIVEILGEGDKETSLNNSAQRKYSVGIDKKKRIVIYEEL